MWWYDDTMRRWYDGMTIWRYDDRMVIKSFCGAVYVIIYTTWQFEHCHVMTYRFLVFFLKNCRFKTLIVYASRIPPRRPRTLRTWLWLVWNFGKTLFGRFAIFVFLTLELFVVEKSFRKKIFRREKIESCKSSETHFAEVSRWSEPCSRSSWSPRRDSRSVSNFSFSFVAREVPRENVPGVQLPKSKVG